MYRARHGAYKSIFSGSLCSLFIRSTDVKNTASLLVKFCSAGGKQYGGRKITEVTSVTSVTDLVQKNDINRITIGCWRCTYPSIHLFRLKIAVGCLTRQDHIQAFTFSRGKTLSRSRSVARAEHISKHSPCCW